MELSCWLLATRLTWKPWPVGHPDEGGLTDTLPREVSTKALRICE